MWRAENRSLMYRYFGFPLYEPEKNGSESSKTQNLKTCAGKETINKTKR